MVNSATDIPSEKQDNCPRPVGSGEQNTPDEKEFINSVLDSVADQNLDVLSAEEIEDLILEMEKAADEKSVPAIPLPDVP